MSVATTTPTTPELADALIGSAPTLDDPEREIVLATYRLLVGGSPVTDARIAERAGVSVELVSQRLAEWPGVFRNSHGAVVGFWGLAIDPLDPTYTLKTASEQTAYAWCAWDTLFLPAMLDQELDVQATDGLTGEPIRLKVNSHGVQDLDPASAVVTFIVPDGPFDADVVAGFCHKVLFFSDQQNAQRWMEDHPDRLFAVSVQDAFEVGRLWTAGVGVIKG